MNDFRVMRAEKSFRKKLHKKIKKLIRSAKDINLPMKYYEGDCENNEPEFDEVSQRTVLLAEFLRNKDLWKNNQIKLELCDGSLWFENEFLENSIDVLKEHGFHVPVFGTNVNWRISGRGWRFPEHFDCVNQVIVQLYGKKKWLISGNEFILETGDALFLKMGTLHKAENLETSLIMNFQYVPEELEKLSVELTAKFENRFPLRVKNIDSGKDFR